MFTNTKESGLETLIVKWLVEHNGYEEGSNADYNKEYAIDETRLFRFLQDTQRSQMDKLGVFKSACKAKLQSAVSLMCCVTASRRIRSTSSCSI